MYDFISVFYAYLEIIQSTNFLHFIQIHFSRHKLKSPYDAFDYKHIAYPEMEEMLLTTQDITKVDGVSGATYSRYRFRYAVCLALMKALI
jgi:major membrane immunogen (membrane-anchored lipoprotein)